MKETMNNNFEIAEKVLVTAIDHGFGNIKTVNTCFKTGVVAYDSEPTFKNNLLVYEGRYFKIGEGHKEFIADKVFGIYPSDSNRICKRHFPEAAGTRIQPGIDAAVCGWRWCLPDSELCGI